MPARIAPVLLLCAVGLPGFHGAAFAAEEPAWEKLPAASGFITHKLAWKSKAPSKCHFTDVAVSPGGDILALRRTTQRSHWPYKGMDVYSPDGKHLRFHRNVEDKPSRGYRLACDAGGHYYVLSDGCFAYEFDTSGRYVGQIVMMHPEMVRYVSRFDVSPDGNRFYTVDVATHLGEYDRIGRVLGWWRIGEWIAGGNGAQGKRIGVRRITDVAVARDGCVFVTLDGQAAVAVSEEKRGGVWTFGKSVRKVGGKTLRPVALGVSNRTVAVADKSLGIFIFDRNGCLLDIIRNVSAASLAVLPDDRVVIAAWGKLLCYERKYSRDEPTGPLKTYLEALDAFESGDKDKGAKCLHELAEAKDTPATLKETALHLLESGPSRYSRHLLPYRPPALDEVQRMYAARAGKAGMKFRFIERDPFDKGWTWVAAEGEFAARCSPDEEFELFETFLRFHGLHEARCIAFTDDSVWLGTGRGLVRFDRGRKVWLPCVAHETVREAAIKSVVAADGRIEVETESGKKVALPAQ